MTYPEVRQMVKPLTFEQKREIVWEDYARGLIGEVRASEMLREIGYQEKAAGEAADS